MAQSSKITTRNGAKLRTATRRRFVVITEAVKFDGTPDAWVTKRSDDLDTLRAFWRSRGAPTVTSSTRSKERK